MRRAALAVWLVLMPVWALAEVVQLPGPDGPLEGEALLVPGADHAVVIVPGSGPIDRDGNAPGTGLRSDVYRLLAEGLSEQGITTLRVDKRGFFGSAGAVSDPNAVTIAGYAEDVHGWVDHAADLAPCVWIAGHSEGGLVALVAAQDRPEALCGLILLATPGRPVGQLLIEQMQANPANGPLMPQVKSLVADLESGRTQDPETLHPSLQPLFSDGLQRFMTDLFSHDPVALAQNWDGPVLIVQGAADMQVRPLDADLLQDAMPHARRLDLPGGTHMLKHDQPGRPFASYSDPDLPLHEGITPAIAAFVADAAEAERPE